MEFPEEDCVVRLGISVIIAWTRILCRDMQISMPERRSQVFASELRIVGWKVCWGSVGFQNRASLEMVYLERILSSHWWISSLIDRETFS